MKLNLTVTIDSARPDKKGLCQIRIRSSVKGKRRYYGTGICVYSDQFENGVVVKHKSKVAYNIDIHKKMEDIERGVSEGNFSLKSGKKINFKTYCEAKIKQQKSSDSHGTWKHKKSYLKKVDIYKPFLNFSDITPDFMKGFENYCRTLGNKPTTIWSSVKFITTMINAAIEDKIIPGNPKKGYKAPKYINPERHFLTDEEIELIEDFASTNKNKTLVKVAQWFLFGVYTGLRYSDIADFTNKKVMNGRIILRTGKSLADVSIKVHPKLKNILGKLDPHVFSNQKMNEYLKIITERCDIEKNVTCHTARHTHAVYFLTHGGSIEALSKILGHSSIRTTSIYGKIIDLKIDNEMGKVWGK